MVKVEGARDTELHAADPGLAQAYPYQPHSGRNCKDTVEVESGRE